MMNCLIDITKKTKYKINVSTLVPTLIIYYTYITK